MTQIKTFLIEHESSPVIDTNTAMLLENQEVIYRTDQ